MKFKFLSIIVCASLAMGITACADDHDKNDLQELMKCTADVCKDASTLLVCDKTTGKTTSKTCEFGCNAAANQCNTSDKPKKCTADVCKDASTLLVCDKTTGKTTSKTCEFGCNAAANQCNTSDKPEKCTVDICKDASTLLVCDKTTGSASEKICPNGCAEGRCTDKTDNKCTADVCKDASTLLVCNKATGKTTEKLCENGCDAAAGKCKEKSDAKVDACANIKCAAGSVCSKGVCVPDSMKNVKENDLWQEGWVEHCKGDTAVFAYDDEDGVTYASLMDCSSKNGCSIVNVKNGAADHFMAWCVEDNSQCRGEDQYITYCDASKAVLEYAYQSQYQCARNTEGGWTAVDLGMIDDVKFCASDACAGSICKPSFDKENELCMGDEDEYCTPDGIVAYCDNSLWSGIKCAFDDASSKCLSYTETDGMIIANCFSDETLCKEGDKEESVCLDEFELATAVCVKTSDNKFHTVENSQLCYHGCKNNACVKLDPNEGNACDAAYKASCTDKKIALNCYDDTVIADQCDTCMVIDGEAQCVESCTKAGSTKTACEFGMQSNYECIQNGSDPKALYWEKVSEFMCTIDCADNKVCKNALDNTKTKCNQEAVDKCLADTEDEFKGCAVPKDALEGQATCHVGKCDQLGEIPEMSVCLNDPDAIEYFGGVARMFKVCSETKGDGNVILFDYEICESDECSEDGKTCRPVQK